MPGRLPRLARALARGVLRILLLLIVVEGTASWLGFALDLPTGVRPPERERLHMQHDSELGWAHIPGTRLENFYGAGRHLTINRSGLRQAGPVGAEAGVARSRAICTGSELTLGIGVGDDETWCARFGARETGLETLNMGQGGYGLDQAYLWYRRDGAELEADLLIFALTREGFARMERDTFEHYRKPTLRRASSGALQARGVPVPRPLESGSWLVRNATLFEQLRIVELARPAFEASWGGPPSELTTSELAALSVEVFESLRELTRERNTTLVLVYLPSGSDASQGRDLWRRRIAQEAHSRGIAFIDLVEAQLALAPEQASQFYVRPPDSAPSVDMPSFSEQGHAWVAETLSARLRLLPESVAALEPETPSIP